MPAPQICIEPNPEWINPATRPGCKYAPVLVSKQQTPEAIESMKAVLDARVGVCRELGIENKNKNLRGVAWFSFLRSGPSHEPHLRSTNVPVIVISGGSALKIVRALDADYSLAWHPVNLRNEPLYLLVHRLDFKTYQSALAGVMSQYRNMHLIGWDGGKMTGFGAARAAALAFAESLPYRPQRILLMDQDVVQTERTRHTRPLVQQQIASLHQPVFGKKQPVVGFGVGYPTRGHVPAPFKNVPRPAVQDFGSPAQQFVSIMAPFRPKQNDGVYPAFMVAGGEDMLMGYELDLIQDNRNVVLRNERIVKIGLEGPADPVNAYWNTARVETLRRIFEVEKDTPLKFKGSIRTLHSLMNEFSFERLIGRHPSAESYNTAACVIERIILRYFKLAQFGHHAVFSP